jgi:hypothetical protein
MVRFSEHALHSDLVLPGNECVGLLESSPMAMLLIDKTGT